MKWNILFVYYHTKVAASLAIYGSEENSSKKSILLSVVSHKIKQQYVNCYVIGKSQIKGNLEKSRPPGFDR